MSAAIKIFLLQMLDIGPIKMGVGQYGCPYCPEVMKAPSLIQRHILTHTGERPYTCMHCNAKFARKGNCERHIKTHQK